jgi:hypothetical protein
VRVLPRTAVPVPPTGVLAVRAPVRPPTSGETQRPAGVVLLHRARVHSVGPPGVPPTVDPGRMAGRLGNAAGRPRAQVTSHDGQADPGQGGSAGGFRSTGRARADGESRGQARTPSGYRPGRPAAGGDSRRDTRTGSGPRWAADDDGVRSRGAAPPRDGESASGGRPRRPSAPGTARPADGGYRGARSTGTRSYGARGTTPTETRRERAVSDPVPPARRIGRSAIEVTPPGGRRVSARQDPGATQAATGLMAARGRDGDRGRDGAGGGDRSWGSEHGRSTGRERPGGGYPRSGDRARGSGRTWAGRDEAPARPPRESGPQLPDSVTPEQLDPEARSQLNSLPNDLADIVARYLVAADLADDPSRATPMRRPPSAWLRGSAWSGRPAGSSLTAPDAGPRRCQSSAPRGG